MEPSNNSGSRLQLVHCMKTEAMNHIMSACIKANALSAIN